MRNFYIIRNAYAHETYDYKDGKEDRERELRHEGIESIIKLDAHAREILANIDRVLCSAIPRGKQTLELLSAFFKNKPHITYHEEFYSDRDNYKSAFWEALKEVSDEYKNILILAHNPGLSKFYNEVGEERIHFPTTGIGFFKTEIENWKDVDRYFVHSQELIF